MYVKNHRRCEGMCDHLKKFYATLSAIFENIKKERGETMKLGVFKIDKIESVS
jgi:hypothetical protein